MQQRAQQPQPSGSTKASIRQRRQQAAAAAKVQHQVQAAFAARGVHTALLAFLRKLAKLSTMAAMQLREALRDLLAVLEAAFAYCVPAGAPDFAAGVLDGLQSFQAAYAAVRKQLTASGNAELQPAYAAVLVGLGFVHQKSVAGLILVAHPSCSASAVLAWAAIWCSVVHHAPSASSLALHMLETCLEPDQALAVHRLRRARGQRPSRRHSAPRRPAPKMLREPCKNCCSRCACQHPNNVSL